MKIRREKNKLQLSIFTHLLHFRVSLVQLLKKFTQKMQDKLGCQKMIKSTLSLLTKLQNYKTKKYYSFCLHSSLSSKNASSLPLFLTKLHRRHFATPHQVPKNIDHKALFHLKTLKKNEPTPMSFLKPQHCHAYNGQWQLQGRTQCCCVHKKAKIASMKDMML